MIPDFGRSVPLAPPWYPSAVYQIPDLDTLDAIYGGQSAGFIYARDGHPNAEMLAADLTARHGGTWGVVTSTGMSALAGPFAALLSAGDHVLASNQLYGKTTKLLGSELQKFGVRTTWVDTADLAAVRSAIDAGPVRLVVVETISNPLCRVADIPELARMAHQGGAKLLVDNTFASPVLCRPLELGADLVMESLTKMIGGHSDVTLGFVAGTDSELKSLITGAVSTWGMSASPFDCWLTLRGATTLELRMPAAVANTLAVARHLVDQPGVKRVYYPGLLSHPDHGLAGKILPSGAGHMLCFELADRDAVNRWMRTTPQIPFCPSLGHHTTTCSYPDGTSHRFVPVEEKRRLGITPELVRLSVGCEPLEQIRSALRFD